MPTDFCRWRKGYPGRMPAGPESSKDEGITDLTRGRFVQRIALVVCGYQEVFILYTNVHGLA